MSDFLIADGFGYAKDGTHTSGVDTQIIGDFWASFGDDFDLVDIADGRKWMTPTSGNTAVQLVATGWTGKTDLTFCMRVYPTDRDECAMWKLVDGASVIGFIGINSSGQVVYMRGTSWNTGPTTVLNSTVIPLNEATHIEVRVVLSNAAGAVYIYLNGVLNASTTGADTIHNGTSCDTVEVFDNLSFGVGFLPAGWKVTDFVVHESATPIGDVGVYYVATNAAGTDADWTPSAGSNYQNCDEIGPDDDTTYNETSGDGDRDSFNCDTVTGVTVLSVCAHVRARKTGAGTALLKVGVIENGSEDQSSSKSLSTSYANKTHFVDDNPDTAAAWSLAELAAAEVSYELSST